MHCITSTLYLVSSYLWYIFRGLLNCVEAMDWKRESSTTGNLGTFLINNLDTFLINKGIARAVLSDMSCIDNIYIYSWDPNSTVVILWRWTECCCSGAW